MIEATILAELVKGAYAWTERVAADTRDKGQQRAAHLLCDAGILIGAMRTLTSEMHAVVRELSLYGPDWSYERREQVAERLLAFGAEPILFAVEQSSASVQTWLLLYRDHRRSRRWLRRPPKSPEFDPFALEPLLLAREDWLNLILNTEGGIPPFCNALLGDHSGREQERFRGWAGNLLNDLERSDLSAADRAFAQIQTKILDQYPRIPHPGWTALIPAPK